MTRWALPAAIAVVVVAAIAVSRPAAAAVVTVDAQRRGDAIRIHAQADLEADATTAWQVLTDYDRYVDFVPDLRVSRVVARRGTTVVVEQSGEATLWLFRMPLDVTFEIDERAPGHLQSRAVAGSLRALASSYSLTPTASGVRLDYTGHVAPGFALFGYLEELAVRSNIARQFQALADEIERRSAAKRANLPAIAR